MISQAIHVTIMMLLATELNSAPIPTATCPTSCGNLTIPFPFGTSSDCSLDNSFLITCNHDYNHPKPFLNLGSIEVLDISLDGLMKVASSVASDCYDNSGSQINGTISELTLSKFPISSTRNKFTAVGCDTYALVEGSEEWKQMSAGCVSWCDSIDRVVNGTCSGIGCCQTSIPKGVKDFLVDIRSFRNHTAVKSFNPCGYAFVVETEAFEFSSSDLKDLQNRKTVPVVLDWSVGNVSCQEARKDLSSFACRANHSECSDSGNGLGYHCKCLAGFQGNPYVFYGCQDIDECTALKPCEGTCKNLQGSYLCSCPKGFEGNGKKDGSGCHPKSPIVGSTWFHIASGFMVPAVGSSWIFWRRRQKKVDRLRRNLYIRNGGLLLEEMLYSQGTLSFGEMLSQILFKAEDLKKATNNYNENNVISSMQHFGINYKGMLPDGRIVTITKCDALGICNIEVFISKLVKLFVLCHRNVVKLLGCCLETAVPLLVSEFSDLDSLRDYILDDDRACHLSWDIRLRIAAATASVLAHMHSELEGQMIHGRLSSSSILLQHDYTVKIHDFFDLTFSDGSFVDLGRLGYLDPQYLLTNQLTVESDVYSFGVVLAEILTGKKVISCDRPKGEEHLAQYLVNRGDNLLMILDHRLGTITDGKIDELREVAEVAKRCLSYSRMDRPTMKEVVLALENAIRNMNYGSTTVCPNPSQETTTDRTTMEDVVITTQENAVNRISGSTAIRPYHIQETNGHRVVPNRQIKMKLYLERTMDAQAQQNKIRAYKETIDF